MDNAPTTVATQLYTALEAGQHGEALQAFIHDEAEFIEYPNLITPEGATRDLRAMKESSERGATLLAKQRYEVRDAIEHGDIAIVRLTWKAEIARDIGPFHKGQQLTAHIAQFIKCRAGRIVRLETYDCYEPFKQS
jgi:ketosteroid isomerase-like protein